MTKASRPPRLAARMAGKAKNILIIIISIIVVGLLVWWGITKEKAPETKEPIKIGAILPLTGNLAKNGEEIRSGLELAVGRLNFEGGIDGRQLKLLIEDNEGESSKAVSSLNKLLNIDEADIIISGFTHLVGAIAPIIDENKKLLIYQSTVSNFAKESSYIFKDYFDVLKDGELLAAAALKNEDRKIATIYLESDACNEFIDSFENNLNRNGGEMIAKEEFTFQDRDYRTQLTKIRNLSTVDGLLIVAYPFQQKLIFKQIKELGINLQVYGMWSLFPEVIDDPTSLFVMQETNAIVTDYASIRTIENSRTRNFEDEYWNRYGRKPSYNSYYAYDDILILVEAIKGCNNSENVECLKDKLLEEVFKGLAEDISFDKYGVSIRRTYIKQFKDGEIVDYELK